MAFTSVKAQKVVVLVNSPESLADAYLWETGFGADLTSNLWIGDCVIVDDGSANPTQGCNAPVNDVSGKIVLIDRGSCEFGTKALNAQDAGAMAAVILNNVGGGPVPMGAGASGAMVTIPTVMLSMEDGMLIKDAINNGETVNMTIGPVQFENDLSINNTFTNVPYYGTIPSSQIMDPGLTNFIPAATINNDGSLDAPNPELNAVINFTPEGGSPTEVYNESAVGDLILADTGFTYVELSEFDYTGSEKGVYEIAYYTSHDSTDQLPFDNDILKSVTVSENVYSKARWDPTTGTPETTSTLYTVGGGGNIELFAPILIPNGVGYKLDSIKCYNSANGFTTLAGLSISGNIYEWIDVDGNELISEGEVERLATGAYVFPGGAAQFDWATIPLLDINLGTPSYIIPYENARYLVGVQYEGSETVFFGFDEVMDHSINLEQNFTPTWMEVPYFLLTDISNGVSQFPDTVSFANTFSLNGALAISLHMSEVVVNTQELSDLEAQINLYPNPTSSILNVEVALEEQTALLTYKISDIQGKLVTSREARDVDQDQNSFDLSKYASGQYQLTIETDKGIKTKPFTVHR